MTATTKRLETFPSASEQRAVLERADKGDESVLPALRKMLENPSIVEGFGGNLARQAEQSFVKAAGGENLAFKDQQT